MTLFDCHTHCRNSHHRALVDFPATDPIPPTTPYASVSIHPLSLNEENAHALQTLLIKQAQLPNVVALGEVGLDKRSEWPLDHQASFLETVIQLSETVQKPLILHCVKAMNMVVLLRQHLAPRQAWVMHGFRGNRHTARQLLQHGFYLSYGAYFNEEAVRETPANRLLIETDALPHPLDAQYSHIARLRGEELNKLAAAVWENAQQVFSIA